MRIISFKTASALFLCSFIIRALVMAFFIQPNHFYKQADSFDYHKCATNITHGCGMHRLETGDPVFWRTPGYPQYLAWFYRLFGCNEIDFDQSERAQQAAIWLQILISSLIPILLCYLAFALTQTYAIALITGWISVFHPGLVLASTYLLTEGLALIFFYLFLLFFYQLILARHPNKQHWAFTIIHAALALSIYTWMRPMGEFVGYFSALLIFIAGVGSWRQTFKQAVLFVVLIAASLAPWYYRNYKLTGEYFFCPTIGTYVNCFSVPKILRRTLDKPIIECFHIAQQKAAQEVHSQMRLLAGTGKHVSNNACKRTAFPVIAQHPFYFMYDWIAETIKTTFDLYSYQLVAMFSDAYWYDPIEEFLPEKIAACLYAYDMPISARAVCWLEFLYALFLWVGLFAGLWLYIMNAIIAFPAKKSSRYIMIKIWLTTLALSGIIIGMTGGFGYARLRLPAEPLLLILSLTFWYWLYKKETKK